MWCSRDVTLGREFSEESESRVEQQVVVRRLIHAVEVPEPQHTLQLIRVSL
jgi:hypothetical protein